MENVEKSSVAKMIDDLHERFIRSQGDNGTFPKLESAIKADRRHASEADAIDPVITSSDAVKGLANGGEVRNPNEKKGMKEEAGNYYPGGEVPEPQSGPDFLAMMNNAPNGGMDVSGDAPPPPQNPSLSDTTSALNSAPDTNYDFYGNTGSDQRAALYKGLLDKQSSPGNLIAQGLGGIGDAFSAAGGKSTDFQDKARGISTENTTNRIGQMDTQRSQKLQDLQGNQEQMMADPKHPIAVALRQSFKNAGFNVGSGMPASVLLKLASAMGPMFEKQAVLAQNAGQFDVTSKRQAEELDRQRAKDAADVANQKTERTQGAARTLSGRGMFKRITDAVVGDPGTQALEAQVAGGQPAAQAAPAGQPMTATNSMGHKITSTDGGKTWQ